MKGMLRRISAMLLAVVLVLGTGVTVLADSLSTATASLSIAGATAANVDVVTSTSTVTITGIPVEESTTSSGTYEVAADSLEFATYQIAYATYDSNYNSLEYHLTEWAYAALVTSETYADEDAAIAALVESRLIIYSDTATTYTSTSGGDTKEQSAILNTLTAYVAVATSLSPAKDTSVMGSSLSWTVNDSTLTASNVTNGTTADASLPVGAYLVLPSSSNMAFLNMLVSVDTSATTGTAKDEWQLAAHNAVLKGNLITIDKKVSDGTMVAAGDTAQAQVGDTLYYTITVDVPKFAANSTNIMFKVTDTPENVAIGENSVVVKAYTDATNKATLEKNKNYTVSVDSSTGVLTVDFSNNYMSTFYTSGTGVYPYAYVEITYEAELLSTAVVTSGNKNAAELAYKNETNGENTAEDKTTVYTYQLELTKDGESTATALSNASFIIATGSDFTSANTLSFTGSNGVYEVADRTIATADILDAVTTASDGTLTLTGLDAGVTYYIKESVAPSGYSLNTNYLVFTITGKTNTAGDLTGIIAKVSEQEYKSNGDEVNANGSWTIDVKQDNGSNTASLSLTLTDTKLPSLPATGSVGIIIFTIAGVALMIAAVFILYSGKSREKSGGEKA